MDIFWQIASSRPRCTELTLLTRGYPTGLPF
jgi:hypothetical protein